jgi:protein-disulfide isomerase
MNTDRTIQLVMLGLATAGIALALFLTWAHFAGTLGTICSKGGGCGVVLTSTFSQFLGLPTAFYGFVFYFTMTLLIVIFPYVTDSSQHHILTTILGLTSAALVVSLLLTIYSAFGLNELCGYCLFSTALVFGLFAGSVVWTVRRTRLNPPEHPWEALWKSASAVLLVLLVIVGGFYYQSASIAAPTEQNSKELRALAAEPTAVGDPNSPIRVIEFFDLSCPYCQRFTLNVFPKIRKNYIETGKVTWIFRDLPITRAHPHSLYAHGILSLLPPHQYLEAKKRIMRNADQWNHKNNDSPKSYFDFLLRQYGMNPQKPPEPLKQSIMSRARQFSKMGVRATPSFIINGKLYTGGLSYERISKIFDSILRRQTNSRTQ